jgi:cell division protease FtsH
MVARFGMDAKLGQVSYEPETAPMLDMPNRHDWQPRRYGEATAGAIDAAVRTLIDDAYNRAVAILSDNRQLLDDTAESLLAQETFSAADLKLIGAGLVVSPRTTTAVQREAELVAQSRMTAGRQR